MSVKVRTPETNPLKPTVRIFLAGSIENGLADNWQDRVAKELAERYNGLDCNVIINNPRRGNWDSSRFGLGVWPTAPPENFCAHFPATRPH